MPKLQGLIFDLDGTLVDSAPDLRHAINQTLAENGRRGITLDEMKSFVGDGMLPMLQRAFAATGAGIAPDESYKLFQNFIGHYRALRADTAQIYPQVVAVLEGFVKAGIVCGVCTNKQEASTHKLLDELNMSRFFKYVAGGDTFPTHKPHPDHVKGVIERLGVPASGCVMVGDSINDVRAAQGAGIPCVVVTQGYGYDVSELGADALIAGFDELRAAVEKLGFELP